METDKEKITELTEETESPATENADRAIESETAKADNTEAKEELTPEQIKLKRKNDIIRILKFVGFSCSAGVIQFVVFTILNEVLHLIYTGLRISSRSRFPFCGTSLSTVNSPSNRLIMCLLRC